MMSTRLATRPNIRLRRLVLAAALTLAAAPTFMNPASADATVSVRNQTTVRNAFQRWASGENVIPSLLAPDIAWTILGSGPVAGTYRGVQDFVERASGPLVSRLATPLVPKVHHIWAVGDRVIVRFEAAATTTGGHPYRNQFVWLLRMKDDRVAEAEAFLDLAAYQQVVDNNAPRQR